MIRRLKSAGKQAYARLLSAQEEKARRLIERLERDRRDVW